MPRHQAPVCRNFGQHVRQCCKAALVRDYNLLALDILSRNYNLNPLVVYESTNMRAKVDPEALYLGDMKYGERGFSV